jgi:aspartate/glutamate racemase
LKILGVIGGIAPGSTIEYYRLLIEGWRQKMPGRGYPPILINSIDLDRMLAMVAADQHRRGNLQCGPSAWTEAARPHRHSLHHGGVLLS